MRALRERELLIHRGKKASHGLNTMSKRTKCFALSAEGMIAQVLFVLEARNLSLKKKRMPYFSDNRSRLRGEEDDGPAEIPGHHDAHVRVEAQQEVQAAVPGPSDDAKDDDDGNLSNYYSDDELFTDVKLIDQENEAYEKLTSLECFNTSCVDLAVAVFTTGFDKRHDSESDKIVSPH